MEYGLGPIGAVMFNDGDVIVLILLLMEYGLGLIKACCDPENMQAIVLILLLMEYGLGLVENGNTTLNVS